MSSRRYPRCSWESREIRKEGYAGGESTLGYDPVGRRPTEIRGRAVPQDFQEGPASSLEGRASAPASCRSAHWAHGYPRSHMGWGLPVCLERERGLLVTLDPVALPPGCTGPWRVGGPPGSRMHWPSPGDENAHSRPRAHPRGEREGRPPGSAWAAVRCVRLWPPAGPREPDKGMPACSQRMA